MTRPSDLTTHSQDLLAKHSFELTDSSDNGMWKHYLWTNLEMQFSLTYDRGYYDCDIIPSQKPINRMSLIRLLRFLKKDKDFYSKELIDVNLWYTLTVNQYVELFSENYNLIGDFVRNFNQDKYDNYNDFEFAYNGI